MATEAKPKPVVKVLTVRLDEDTYNRLTEAFHGERHEKRADTVSEAIRSYLDERGY